MTDELTASIHRALSGWGYDIKYPRDRGPYDSWALTLRGARRRAQRQVSRYYRRVDRRENAVAVVGQVKVERRGADRGGHGKQSST